MIRGHDLPADREIMKKVLQLALRGSGYVSPNPRVGTVIVKDGEIISEGWHEKFGRPHAEVNAIKNSDIDNFEEAELFVNLEPCTHFGKTPPCADLIIEKKFKRVVIGMEDPNPEVAGRGIEKIKQAGIEVVTGILEDQCKWVNRFFIKHISTGKPYIILKAAQSLDGFIALRNNESKWISCEESRRRVHILRSQTDAVLIGRNTCEKDDASLTVRHVKGRDPYRIIIDPDLELKPGLKIFNDGLQERTIIICRNNKIESAAVHFSKVIIAETEENGEGQLNIETALKHLSDELGIASVLVEGGSFVHSYFIKNNLADELQLFITPKIFGSGISAFAGYSVDSIPEKALFKLKAFSKSGDDIHIIYFKN